MDVQVPQGSILIVDFGSQLARLIARRFREMGVYARLEPYFADFSHINLAPYAGFVFSGGPDDSYKKDAPALPAALLASGKPCLGVCYGAQRMAMEAGGTVLSSSKREFGDTVVRLVDPTDPLLAGVSAESVVWMSHGDRIDSAPPSYQITSLTQNGVTASMRHSSLPLYAVQFHPEADHSEYGRLILKNFLFNICHTAPNWHMDAFLEEEIALLKREIGSDEVLLALSGGVDSLVTAVLLHRAVGSRLRCVMVDHGLLRLGERERVEAYVRANFSFDFTVVEAQERFLSALVGVTDPERKRKIIGAGFIDVLEEAAQKMGSPKYLAQGTIYPDVIESGGGASKTIKSHHNVGGLPERMRLKVVEPLRALFKDEVRALGERLGIPRELLYRHPFPGPGFAVRVIGEIRPDYLATVKSADAIFTEELRLADLYDKVAQAFCVFLPVKSVGVMGDNRTYAHVIALRAVETDDFMTARPAPLPFDFLARVASRIVNEVPGVNRVTYDITGKPPATVEWE